MRTTLAFDEELLEQARKRALAASACLARPLPAKIELVQNRSEDAL